MKGKWDLLIAHPPCTYLATSGNRWFNREVFGDEAIRREIERENASEFFMSFANADCDHIAIENPVGVMSSRYRKPDQIISPWMFGDNHEKRTCLWLKGLPKLVPEVTEKPDLEYYEWTDHKTGRRVRQPLWYYLSLRAGKDRAKVRSKTFDGIARAFAEQWAGKVEE